VLSPTLRNANNPIKKLENILVKNNIPVYFSRNEEEGIDEKIIAGKTVFTTFHQSKGRERKIVFVFGFDESYFDFFAQDKNRMSCPSELYVAITRASEILCIIEHDKNESLSFLKVNPDYFYMHSQYIEYYHNNKNNNKDNKENKENKKEIKDKNKEKTKIHNTSVNDLTMYLSEMTMRQLSQMIRVNMLFNVINPPQEKYTVDIPSNVTMQNGLVEDVSDLNGLVIPAIYEANIMDGKSSIQKIVENYCSNATKENRAYIDNKKKELIKHQKNPISIYFIFLRCSSDST
jgi:superfamily I DNA/RNA helicase